LTEKEIGGSGHKGHAVWLSSGLKIQEMQYGFDSFVTKASYVDTQKLSGYRFKPWSERLAPTQHPTKKGI
jgi:hypothetical protein